jgi:hypothetical protein
MVSLMNHHDAITGTPMGYVATWYAHTYFNTFDKTKHQLSFDLSKKVKQLANIDVKP